MGFQSTQPNSTIGTDIVVKDLLQRCCEEPMLYLTAMTDKKLGELMMLALDVNLPLFEESGKIEMNMPRRNTQEKMAEVKSLGRLYKEYSPVEKGIQLTELSNEAVMMAAVGDISASNTGTFTSVGNLIAGDTIRIIKSDSTNITVPATVSVTSVNAGTNEVVFDQNVTIADGDYIRFIGSKQAWCNTVLKGVSDEYGNGKEFTFYYGIFARTFDVKIEDMNKCFMKNSQQAEDFYFRTMYAADRQIWQEAADKFRYGRNISGSESEPMGYDTLISLRDANGLDSVIDFTADTTAEEFNARLIDVWSRVKMAPVDTEWVMLINNSFYKSYLKMHDELRKIEFPRVVSLIKENSLYSGLHKYAPQSDDFAVPTIYLSESLSTDNPDTPIAYILPKDMIALFIPPVINVEFNGKVKTWDNQLGKIVTEKLPKDKIGCSSYQKYMTLGYIYGGFSFRDTYFRLENFDF